MMDVDQPVTSTTGEEQTEMDAESSHENIADKSPGMIVRENDDLPALLISDSEEDDTPKAPVEEAKIDEISGITAIETTTVADGNDKCDDVGTETTATQEPSALPAAGDEEEISLVENIDLTGASSTEDFGANEPSNERTTFESPVKPPTLSKPSSEMTAQELLESLLEAQEEAFASQRASLNVEKELTETTLMRKDANKAADASEMEKITNKNPDSVLSEDAKEAINPDTDDRREESSKIHTLDDACELNEMVNAIEKQQEKDFNEHHTGTNKTSCSDDGAGGTKQNLDESEGATALKCYDSDDIVTLTETGDEKSDDMLECAEPPRKRARSMLSDPEPELKAGTTESTFRSIENDTIQHEKLSEEAAKETDDLCHRAEQMDIHVETNTNLFAVEAEPASASLESKSQTIMMGSSDSSNNNSGLLNSDPQNKQCVAVSGQKNVQAVDTSVCPDVLVIDDDEDEAEVSNYNAQDADDKQIATPENNNLQMDHKSDITVKNPDVDSNSQTTPAPEEKMEAKPMAMEFMRRFSKPISRMTRSDLEQLILQKLSETIVHQSENAELRRIIKRQSAKLQGYERTIADMANHYEGLKLVAERAVEDMKKRSKMFVAPVKITRAVGLQVSRPTMEMMPSYKASNIARVMSEKRKNSPATATVTTNGIIENRAAQTKPSELNKTTQQPVPAFSTGQKRSQILNNVSPMSTARITPTNSPMANGVIRTLNSQVGKHNNSITTTSASITSANSVKLAAVVTNEGAGASNSNTAIFGSTSPHTGSAANNSIAGGIDNTVRKKFHKFTPKRPPLSPYQQAQQEKQVRQQQELLVQQIHEQSQQAQRKAQVNVRSEKPPTTENSAARAAMDATIRQRSLSQQGRLLNANVQMPVSQSYQIVPFGGLRATTAMTGSTTIQLSEPKSNSQPTATAPSSANDSLIDLTDEDDIAGRESGLVSTIHLKRMKTSHSGSFASTSPISTNPSMQISSNQFSRLQPKINTINGSEIVPAVANNTSVGGINQFNNTLVRAPSQVNRINNGLPALRQPVYNSNLQRFPAGSTDALRKRVANRPLLAPLPHPGPQPNDPTWKLSPPQPSICVNNVQAGIVISWTMPSLTDLHAGIETYQIYAYQELSITTSTEEWRHVGDVKALLLPMAVTLTQFHEGQRYYFAVRAIDEHKRVGKFCEPRTWNDNNVSNI